MAISAQKTTDFDLLQEAYSSILEALKGLQPEERQRVLQSVATLLEIPVVGVSTRTVAYSNRSLESDIQSERDFSVDRTISPKQFLLEKQPKTDVERVACLAYYLTHYMEMPHFKTIDISKLNTEAAQQKFSNPSHSVNNAVKTGYLAPSTKGQRQLSAAGEMFVQALPDRQAARDAMDRSKPRRGGRKRSARVKKTND